MARLWTLVAYVVVLAPLSAQAGDLGESLHFIDETLGPDAIAGYENVAQPNDHTAMGFLTARDVEVGRPLTEYSCAEAAVDGEYTLRTNGNERWSGRHCRELRFTRDALPGYQTMGPRALRERELQPILRRAEAATDVPASLLEAVVRFQSGRRPGLVSDDGRQGLMQLSPQLLRGQGIEPINLLDPETNVMLGARYIRSLTLQFKGLKMGLAAYLYGPQAVAAAGDIPDDPETLFFVREVMRLYYASIRDVPKQIAAESVAFVWNWLE